MGEEFFLQDKLKGEYKETFEKVIEYGKKFHYDLDVAQILLNDLLDKLFKAQQNGNEVDSVVGNNTDAFCEKFYEACDTKNNVFVTTWQESFRILSGNPR